MLSVENIPKEDCDLAKVKDFFKQFGDVQYVVYEKGDEKVSNFLLLLGMRYVFCSRQFSYL